MRAWLRLFRIPNVFTAFANVAAGIWLARDQFSLRDTSLIAASGALYLAGMVWNDYYDRDVDARERPDRPLPAGQIAPSTAAAVGVGLLSSGLALAAWHGTRPLVVAVALAVCILLYDARLKNGTLGPWAMGACRALNSTLGLSVASRPLPAWVWLLPLSLFVFTLLITRLSRFEVAGTAPERLRSTLWGFAALFTLVALALIHLAWQTNVSLSAASSALVALAFLATRGAQLLGPLARTVTPPLLGRAIGGCILLMPALDAAFVAMRGAPLAAAAIFALAAPAYVLKRWYYLT